MSSSIATRTFTAMCGSSQGACQRGQAPVQQEAALRQEFFETCRAELKPIEKDFERGLHIRKLRLGPTHRYKIRSPQFKDARCHYSKVDSEMRRRNFLRMRKRVTVLEIVNAISAVPSTKSVDNLSLDVSTRRCTRAVPSPTHSSPYRGKIVLLGRRKANHAAFSTRNESVSVVRKPTELVKEVDRTSCKLRSPTMSLDPPRYDVDEFGPLLDEFNPLSESYVAPRYDANLRPLVYEDDYLPAAGSGSPSMSLFDGFTPISSDSAPAHDAQQLEAADCTQLLTNCSGSRFNKTNVHEDMPLAGPCQPTLDVQITPADMSVVEPSLVANSLQPDLLELDPILTGSFIDLAELDQYLNAPEPSNGSPAAVVPARSQFDAIISEDHYEDAVAVCLDHPYGVSDVSSIGADSMDLDPSILNEFLTPLPSASSMGPCEGEALNVSPTYLETFTDLEPYLQRGEGSSTPPERETALYVELSSAQPTSNSTIVKPDSTTTVDTPSPINQRHLETPDEYRRRRDKNNIASQKSRRKRQAKFNALKEEELQLKKRNTELLATVCDLERQVNNLKEIMMKAISG